MNGSKDNPAVVADPRTETGHFVLDGTEQNCPICEKVGSSAGIRTCIDEHFKQMSSADPATWKQHITVEELGLVQAKLLEFKQGAEDADSKGLIPRIDRLWGSLFITIVQDEHGEGKEFDHGVYELFLADMPKPFLKASHLHAEFAASWVSEKLVRCMAVLKTDFQETESEVHDYCIYGNAPHPFSLIKAREDAGWKHDKLEIPGKSLTNIHFHFWRRVTRTPVFDEKTTTIDPELKDLL